MNAPPRVHAPPKVHIVKEDEELKLQKLIEKNKAKELKSQGALARTKGIQLIEPVNLTARQINQNILNAEKDPCKKSRCVGGVASLNQLMRYYTCNVAPNVAIMHGLMKSVRIFVKLFDKFVYGEKLEAGEVIVFFHQHLAQVAGFIRNADPWLLQIDELFTGIANDYFVKVKSGDHIEPTFLRPAIEYSVKEMETINMH